MSGFIRVGPEVFRTAGGLQTIGPDDIACLKAAAAATPRRRSRVCLHDSAAATVHEMVIVHHRETYVRPHRHPFKAESLLVIEGDATALFYDDAGRRTSFFRLGPPGAGRPFMTHAPPGVWHGLLVESEWLVFVETARGPFDAQSNEYAPFAPDESASETVKLYVADLRANAAAAFPNDPMNRART